ncbi:MAG: AAA family ATPase [Candidatus Helarchaeota archaeon]
MILGLVGKIGSGKDSVAEILMKKYNFHEQIRFSDPITEFLTGIGLKLNRENYQKIGFHLRKIFGKTIIIDTIVRRIKSKMDQNLIVNGIRYKLEFDAIKNLGSIILGIITDDKIRFQRINNRKRFGQIISWEEFVRYEKNETEIQIDDLLKISDYMIYNNKTLENLEEEVKNVMEKINFK